MATSNLGSRTRSSIAAGGIGAGLIGFATFASSERNPMAAVQRRLDALGIPIRLQENYVANLCAGGGLILYWSAMFNALDTYVSHWAVPFF